MTLPRITVATLFLVCLVSTGSLLAQTPTAVVNGIVVDTTGATVPDAKVTVVNQATNVVSSRNTNSEGAFTIINLLPGNYALTVEKAGFKRTSLAVFKLDVDQTLTEKIYAGSGHHDRDGGSQRQFDGSDGAAVEHRTGHDHRRRNDARVAPERP